MPKRKEASIRTAVLEPKGLWFSDTDLIGNLKSGVGRGAELQGVRFSTAGLSACRCAAPLASRAVASWPAGHSARPQARHQARHTHSRKRASPRTAVAARREPDPAAGPRGCSRTPLAQPSPPCHRQAMGSSGRTAYPSPSPSPSPHPNPLTRPRHPVGEHGLRRDGIDHVPALGYARPQPDAAQRQDQRRA